MNTPEKLSELTADLRERLRFFAETFSNAELARAVPDEGYANLARALTQAADSIAALKVAREALEPFAEHVIAKYAEAHDRRDEPTSAWEIWSGLQVSDLLRARKAYAALSALQLPPEGEDESLGLVGMASASPTPPSADTCQRDCEPSSVAWRPIESAPKDGTVIDLWGSDYGRMPNCYWGRPSHVCGEAGQYCDSDWHRQRPGWVDGTFDHIVGRQRGFTHWRPLPAAPTPNGEDGR